MKHLARHVHDSSPASGLHARQGGPGKMIGPQDEEFVHLPIKVGVVKQRQVSLSVLATVISKNADFFITDAGSKTLRSDIGVHGMASTQGYGIAYPSEHYLESDCEMVVAGLSEEHGKLIRRDFDLPIGAQVRIIPNHSCPVANLAREYVVLDENRQLTWPIDAAANAH